MSRTTKETEIELTLNLDGSGESDIDTGVGFYDHMLTALSKHARWDLTLRCKGDLHVDDHHTVEDCALALGSAFRSALGPVAGIARFGHAYCPLDESLSRAVVDISGRAHAVVDIVFSRDSIGAMSTEMIPHVFESFAANAGITLHVTNLYGSNDHHKAESAFKAAAVALRHALTRDDSAGVPSTKGVL